MGQPAEKLEPIDGTSGGAIAKGNAEAEAKAKGENQSPDVQESMYDPKIIQLIADSEKQLQDIDDKRAELNATKAEVVAKLVAKGLNKDGVKAAIKYYRTAEEKRENFDLSYAVTRKALGVPMQDDLFNAAAMKQVENHQKSKQH